MRFRILTTVAAAAVVTLGGVSAAPLIAQDAPSSSARSEQTEAVLAPGSPILAELSSGLDSKKLKTGDKVTAHTSEAMRSNDGRTIMPRGTKLEGHITQAEARSKGGNASTLGIQFDKAILKDGGEIALDVVVRAIAPRQFSGPSPGEAGPTTIGTNQTSPMSGGHAPPPNASPQSADSDGAPGNYPEAQGPQLSTRSQGAVGMKGFTLDAQAVDGRAATSISSNGKSVKLDEGTRLLLVVQDKKSEAPEQ
jgi:hypothetical protein